MAQSVVLDGPPLEEVAGIRFDLEGRAVVSADLWVKVHERADGVEVVRVEGAAVGVGDMILDLNEMFAQ